MAGWAGSRRARGEALRGTREATGQQGRAVWRLYAAPTRTVKHNGSELAYFMWPSNAMADR